MAESKRKVQSRQVEESVVYGSAEPESVRRNKTGKTVRLLTVFVLMVLAAWGGRSYLEGKSTAATTESAPPPAAPSVVLRTARLADLAVGREYVGRVEAVQSVRLTPEVSAQIAEVHFKEGAMVKAGQTLFTLDSKQYKATVDLRKADLKKAEAALEEAESYHKRLKAADKRSVSASDLDTAQSTVRQAQAGVQQAQALLRLAQIDLGNTKITAPIAGRIGKAEFTKGNYVTPSSGALATIVQVDPVRVAFALPDRDYLNTLEEFREAEKSVYNATIRLPNGEEYPFSGTRDFEENVMDGTTGTIMVRLRFKNEGRHLVPGSMVRVATKPVKKRVAVVVPQESVMTDTQGDFVYVVDAENIAVQRRVTLGAEVGSMREIASGVDQGERVVLYGLQTLRPNMRVAPVLENGDNGARSAAERAMDSGSEASLLPETSEVGKQPLGRKN